MSAFCWWVGVFFSPVEAETPGLREVRTFSAKSAPSEGPLFEAIAADVSGLDLVIPIDTDHPDKRLYYSAMACGSVAAGDLDGDGWPDLFFAVGPVPNRLYQNVGAGDALRFEAVTVDPALADEGAWNTGAVMVDIDDDGDLDLYLCRYDAPNRLWLNDSKPGVFAFHEAAAEWGLDLADASLMPSFADFDNDGDLDVFVVMNALYRKGGRPEGGVPMEKTDDGWRVLPPYDRFFAFSSIDPLTGEPRFDECGRPNRLLRHDGDHFTDVSEVAGLRTGPTHTNGVVWWDYDGDGLLDLYVANDFSATDACYRNQGDGTFVELAADLFQHTTWFSMGAAAEDLNGDGRTDLVVADMAPTTHYRQKVTMGEMGAAFDQMYAAGLPRQNMVNTCFINTGAGLFFECARQAGIAQTDWTWTVKGGDLDCDGRIDLYFTTGHTRDFNNSDLNTASPAERVGKEDWDFFEDSPELREHDLAFRNAEDWHFAKAGETWGLGQRETMTYGAALCDLDRDGDLDLVTTRLEEPPGLFENRAADRGEGRSLMLSLRGNESNRFGVGAKVTLENADGEMQSRRLLTQNGYQESDEPVMHFGVGNATTVKRLTVEWPSGIRQEFSDLATGRFLEISEPSEKTPAPEPETITPAFRPSQIFSQLTINEQPFDDFYRQPLLPHQHSQLGPGLAWGDADGDGHADLFIGGPKGEPGRLLLSRGLDARGEPVFALRTKEPIAGDADREDLGMLWFEADGDGDLDLYVVSGSVECEPGEAELADRLYLNEGDGEFVDASERLPDPSDHRFASGSVVTAADFDRDGDLDLFVGGRVVPGEYPVAARNRLLVNDGNGTFTDRGAAFGLEETGLVTSALWTDVDADGWIDLLVAHEWGAIRLFRNREGSLMDDTESAGLAEATGFWNSLAGRDLDGDGDIDLVAGNLGHNTKYHASPELPEIIYYGEFGGEGKKNLIEAKIDKGQHCLLRSELFQSRHAVVAQQSEHLPRLGEFDAR
ncbi:MAG: VCBS repeat-containing protein [Verrucomicrobiae bacterium]|nr:VCBS repeat-containing protein [Verrucomicrobiae bacterium]